MSIASAITAAQGRVADAYTAISGKGGTLPATQNLSNMPTAINSIPTGGGAVISTLTVTPTTSAQTIIASGGVDGYSPVNVNAVTASIDQNIVAGNIKKDVTILSVTGSYEAVPETKYGLSIDNFIGDVTSGVLGNPTDINGITFTGVTSTSAKTVNNEKIPVIRMGDMGISGTISLPDIESVGEGSLTKSFEYNEITGVDMPKLKRIYAYGMQQAFRQNDITDIDLSSLETVDDYGMDYGFEGTAFEGTLNLGKLSTVSDHGMRRAFSHEAATQIVNENFTGINLSSLTTVGNYGLYDAFSYNSIESVSLPLLTTVDNNGMANAFVYNLITTVSVPLLQTVGQYGLYQAFMNNPIVTISFESLSSVGPHGLGCAFQIRLAQTSTLQSVYFHALTENSFASGDTTAFDDMLKNCSGVTVHFPISLQPTISSWTSVMGGFGGTGTTVLFDLGGCTTTFNVTPNTDNQISVGSEVLSGTSIVLLKGETVNYVIANSTYGIFAGTYTAPNADTDTITADLTSLTFNSLTFNVGITGLSVYAMVGGCTYTCAETSTGVYTLPFYNSTGNSITVGYFVDGGSSYTDDSGSISLTTLDDSISVTLSAATTSTFTRPNLSANGTIGGSNFAVASVDNSSTAYRAVDNSATSYAQIVTTNGANWLEIYNPNPLKITELALSFTSSYGTSVVNIEASNDGTNWENYYNWSGAATTSITCAITNPIPYKYLRLNFAPVNSYGRIRLLDVGMTATYKS